MKNKTKKTIYFFRGLAGNGTTTSLVKYAINNFKGKDKNEALLLTNNDYIIGAKSKLKTFAKIVGLNYQFLSLKTDPSQIEQLTIYDNLFFDLHARKQTIDIDNLTIGFEEHFQIKKVFVLNSLLLPYPDLVSSLAGFDADEIILSFMDYIPYITKSQKEDLDSKIKELSESMPVWISEGPMVPEDLYKFDK